MPRTLEIQEILLNVFGHCDSRADLPSLARTCRAFKEPALDVLWEELPSLSPLTRCLPEASNQLSPNDRRRSFSRPLTGTEWDILQSYTRRIRRISDFRWGIDEKSIEILSNPPTTEPLFLNLRSLHCNYAGINSTHLLHLPFPSLITISVKFDNPHCFQHALKSFSESSPNISRLFLYVRQSDGAFNKLVSSCVCRWRNIQHLICPHTSLDMDALAHLSRMPALTLLSFRQTATLPDCDSPLLFSNLLRLRLKSPSLDLISRFLSWIRLPAIRESSIITDNRPSGHELSSFLASLQTSNSSHTMKDLEWYQLFTPSNIVRSQAALLCLEDLQPCMAFSNLRRIYFDIECNVRLTDSDLLALASAWPYLEQLEINPGYGWNTRGGITPNGLLQLLQKCRSLLRVVVAMDTRGYHLEGSPVDVNLGLTLPRYFVLDVLDSIIEAESVEAVATLFAGVASCSYFSLHAWSGSEMVTPPGWEVYKERWDDVSRRAKDAVRRLS
ncbi:hypothetical protein L210DRAFT_441019 [Boletus edulis BED1]|uniref:F-box domain-containing protein n=1 Tax=Boletus edulis BED1 TaxID=1328754 RepID=A0AAD4BXK4_BOLED|nr:hypothetical protein L210DRAFT_441019 [Boletus edulis BED1]